MSQEQEHVSSGIRSRIGRYRLLGAIGNGGMADVFLALAEGPGAVNKLVVVKQLRAAHRKDAELVTMFMDEARIASRLNHPNVVQTHEVELDGGLPFIAMEFLDGQPFHMIKRRMGASFGLSASLYVLSELLRGLNYAHELRDFDGRPLSVVHRDVNPANVFVTYDGFVKLMDFGIAKALDSVAQTRVGVFKGKLAYMAPEQLHNQPVDRRADVFAAGVMLWEAIAERRMWEGVSEIEIAKRLDAGDLPELPAGGPKALREVCLRAIAIDRDERPQTALELKEAIDAIVEAEGLTLAPPHGLGKTIAEAFDGDRREIAKLIEEGAHALGVANTAAIAQSRPAFDPADETRMVTRPPPAPSSNPVAEQPAVSRWVFGAVALGLGALIGASVIAVRGFDGGPTEHRPKPTSQASLFGGPPSKGRCAGEDAPLVELAGDIDADSVLTCDRRYLLMFNTFVRPGVTLTIEPGTVILGDHESKGTLVVQPGGRLLAEGTPDKPIVFTSEREASQRRPGDWGGVILLGNAPINRQDREGNPIRADVEGLSKKRKRGAFGGDDPDDDSGRLRFVRIEYSGIQIAPNNEINGLTLAGVGRKTVLDHIQVRNTADDCFEFFGGTVDAKHLICDEPGDDGIDWDYGYRGRLQYVVVRSPQGQHGIEGDNDPNGSRNAPVSSPIVANATLCGSPTPGAERYGLLLRRGTRAFIYTTVVQGFDAGLDVRDEHTEVGVFGSRFGPHHGDPFAFAESDDADDPKLFEDDAIDERALLTEPKRDNAVFEGPRDCDVATLKPKTERDVTKGPLPDGFLDQTGFAGAFRDREDNWDEPWAVWDDEPAEEPSRGLGEPGAE